MRRDWLIKMALKNILANKKRSFLTMLGMIVGVGSVITVMAVGAGAESYIFSQLKTFGSNVVVVFPGASDDNMPPAAVFGVKTVTLTLDDMEAMRQIPYINYISPYVNGNVRASVDNKSKNVSFSGVNKDFLEVENSRVINGRFFSEEDGGSANMVVLGYKIASDMFGDSDPVGQKIALDGKRFTVIGVLSAKGSTVMSDQDNQIFVPIVTAQKNLLGINYLSFIRFRVEGEENIALVKQEVVSLLRARHHLESGVGNDFSVRSMGQALDMIGTVTFAISVFLSAIAAISLLVGGVGIMNIMLVAVTERTREIGLRKAVGAKYSDVIKQFLVEAVLLTFTGGMIGVILGVLFAWVIARLVNLVGYYWEFSVTFWSLVMSIAVSVVIGIVFGIYPAYKAAKLNAVEALRYE